MREALELLLPASVVVLPFGLLAWLLSVRMSDGGRWLAGPDDVSTWLAQKRKVASARRPRRAGPAAVPPSAAGLPEAVRQLAHALALGEDCAFALHDALLEAGRPDLAECFQVPGDGRSGWALDLIRGGCGGTPDGPTERSHRQADRTDVREQEG